MKGCWCFNNEKKLLLMVLQQWKGKNETSAGWSCFGNKNDGEMADWNVLGMGRMNSMLNSGDSAVKISSAAQRCFSIVKISSAAQRCFSIVKISSAAQRCFSIVKSCLFEKSASPVL
jgi:hypothetical protein